MTDRDLKPSQSGVFDAVIVGAGFAYAEWAFPCVSSRPGAVLAAPGIGTATQVRAATWRARLLLC